jgi:uncharacterized protein (DUF3820 family)
MKMQKLTDESKMPYGKYKGTKMANVPASYLLYIKEQGYASHDVAEYILENLKAIIIEIEKEKEENEDE